MADREIHLDGGEIALIKGIGLSGSPMSGPILFKRLGNWDEAEFVETLTGLIDLGYLLSNRVNVRLMKDVERASFRIYPSFARELKEALRPRRKDPRERSRRRR
jgi:hypothetical protein